MKTRQGLDFLARCAVEPHLQAAIDDFLASIAVFGFEHCAAGAWSGVGSAKVYRFYFNSWPADWLALYEGRQFFAIDPFPLETRRRMMSFLFSEVEDALAAGLGASEVLNAVRDYGWREVLGIPIHGPGGYQALITMATLKEIKIDARDKAVLQAMAHAIHDRCHATIGFGQRTRPLTILTLREIECMRWVALGKSDGEIGKILGISPSTAHFHVEKVKKKLDTNSRTEAVALLVLDGLL